jgi:hypothetical protein
MLDHNNGLWPEITPERLNALGIREAKHLIEQGNYPEALALDRDAALQVLPGIEELCDAARRDTIAVSIRYGNRQFCAELACWEFDDGVVLGVPQHRLYAVGTDYVEAQEYFRIRMHGTQDGIERGAHSGSRSESLRDVSRWIADALTEFPAGPIASPARTCLRGMSGEYFADRHGHAVRHIREVEQRRLQLTAYERNEYLRVRAWIGCRIGELVPQRHLKLMEPGQALSTMQCSDWLYVARHSGLLPKVWAEDWYKAATQVLELRDADAAAPLVYEYFGGTLTAYGESRAGLGLLQRALNSETEHIASPRVVTRILANYAEALRLTGDYDLARETLAQVAKTQRSRQMLGRLSELTLLNQAKCASDLGVALGYLKEARKLGPRYAPKAVVKALLVEARITADPARIQALHGQVLRAMARIPDLADCPLANRIRREWHEWTRPRFPSPELSYWGL